MICAVVLAAGTSTRMKANKLALPWQTSTVLETTMQNITEAGFAEQLVVLGHQSQFWLNKWLDSDIHLHWQLAINTDYALGQGTSVAVAAKVLLNDEKYIDFCGACFFLGDQPLVGQQTIEFLQTKALENTQKIIVPTYEGKRGNPVYFPRWAWVEIAQLQGDSGARGLFKFYPQMVEYVEVCHRGIVTDLDTREAYEAELAKLK